MATFNQRQWLRFSLRGMFAVLVVTLHSLHSTSYTSHRVNGGCTRPYDGIRNKVRKLRGGDGPTAPMSRVRRIANAQKQLADEGLPEDGPGSAFQRLRTERFRAKAAEAEAKDPLRGQHEHIREKQKQEFFQMTSAETPTSTDPEGAAKYPRDPFRRVNWTDAWLELNPGEKWEGDETFGQEWWRTAYRSYDWDPRNPSFWANKSFQPSQSVKWLRNFDGYDPSDREFYNKLYSIEAPGVPLDSPHMRVRSDWHRLHVMNLHYSNGNYAFNKPIIEEILGLDDPTIPRHIYEGVKARRRVLVLGCGTNDFCLEMRKDGYGAVVGLDWSEEAIRQQRQYHCNDTLYPGLRYDCLDVVEWEVPVNASISRRYNPLSHEEEDIKRALGYTEPPYDTYSANTSSLGKFDLVLDLGCFTDVLQTGLRKTNKMLSHVSREALKPGGVYLVWTPISPTLQTNPLNSRRRFNWTTRYTEVQHLNDSHNYHRFHNHSTLIYSCTKIDAEGRPVLPGGDIASSSDDEEGGAGVVYDETDKEFDWDLHLQGSHDNSAAEPAPSLPPQRGKTTGTMIDADAIYTRLAAKYGWRDLDEVKAEHAAQREKEREARNEERAKRQREERSKRTQRMAEEYQKRREMERQGILDNDVGVGGGIDEFENKSFTDVDTDAYNNIMKPGYDPFEDYNPLNRPEEAGGGGDNDDDNEAILDNEEFDGDSVPKPLWEEIDGLQRDYEGGGEEDDDLGGGGGEGGGGGGGEGGGEGRGGGIMEKRDEEEELNGDAFAYILIGKNAAGDGPMQCSGYSA
eukprot:jgi/Bigna1/80188/fgenesh1_pg.68_\